MAEMAHLKITQKGMLIVSIPLIFETMFIMLLLILLVQINNQIEREENARAVLSRSHHFGRMAIIVSSAVAALGFAMDASKSRKTLDMHLKIADEDLANLLELTRSDPDALAKVNGIKDALDAGKRLIAKKRTEDLKMVSQLDTIYEDPLVQESAECAAKLGFSVQHLVALEQQEASQSLAAVEKTKRTIEYVLLGGLVASILLTVLLMVFFSRNIIQRLQTLSANAASLGRRQPLPAVVTGYDEIAELDVALRRTDEELSQLEKARQNLLAFVSHELKTPLTSLSAFFSLLSDGAFMPLDETARDVCRRATLRIDDISRLIVDLIDVEKMHGGKFKLLLSDVDIPTLVDKSIENHQADNEQNFKIEPEHVVDTVITADRDRLLRVLGNLYRNVAHRAPWAGLVRLSVTETDGFVVFRLSDSGNPIPSALMTSVFQGNQLAGDAESLNLFLSEGLPLVISRMIIEQHEGSFEISSDAASGTNFVFRVPSDALSPAENGD
jgi:signal transduction histidine kinase